MCWKWLNRRHLKLFHVTEEPPNGHKPFKPDPDLAYAKARLALLEAQVSLAGLSIRPSKEHQHDR